MSSKVEAALRSRVPLVLDIVTWPPFIVMAVMFGPNVRRVEYAALPPSIQTAAWGGALFVLVISFIAHELRREKLAMLCVYLVAVLSVVLTINRVAFLVRLLHGAHVDGWALLETGLVVWTSNIFIFSLLYWAVDGGGPADRMADSEPRDWLFPEMTLKSTQHLPNYLDYLCLAFNTSTAFSPTDVVTISTRARALMAVQSAISLATLAIVAARAVNILS